MRELLSLKEPISSLLHYISSAPAKIFGNDELGLCTPYLNVLEVVCEALCR